MKFKATGLLLALAMLVGAMALPAAADVSVGAKVGIFNGQAIVGKSGTCAQDGSHTISGGGIGLIPGVIEPAKNAWYGIDATNSVIDVTGGTGSLKLCGRLTTPLQDTNDIDVKGLTGIGASCLATKGWGGQGKATLDGTAVKAPQDIWISNLGWKLTLGGTFIVTGDVGGEAKKKADTLVAQVQALSQGAVVGCIEKTTVGKASSQVFDVRAAYEIIPVRNPQEKKDEEGKDKPKP